jgi:hypothetical protein
MQTPAQLNAAGTLSITLSARLSHLRCDLANHCITLILNGIIYIREIILVIIVYEE